MSLALSLAESRDFYHQSSPRHSFFLLIIILAAGDNLKDNLNISLKDITVTSRDISQLALCVPRLRVHRQVPVHGDPVVCTMKEEERGEIGESGVRRDRGAEVAFTPLRAKEVNGTDKQRSGKHSQE